MPACVQLMPALFAPVYSCLLMTHTHALSQTHPHTTNHMHMHTSTAVHGGHPGENGQDRGTQRTLKPATAPPCGVSLQLNLIVYWPCLSCRPSGRSTLQAAICRHHRPARCVVVLVRLRVFVRECVCVFVRECVMCACLFVDASCEGKLTVPMSWRP